MDFVEHPTTHFALLLGAHHEALVIIKMFQATTKRQAELEQRFQHFHRGGRWYAPQPALRRFVEQEAPCETIEAKKEFAVESNGRLLWRPAKVSSSEVREEAIEEGLMPGFVKNARLFVLWAIADVATTTMECSSRMVVTHPANQGVYKAKTIYNTLYGLIEEGKVVKTKKKGLLLASNGQDEIDGLMKVWELKQAKRTKSLRLY